MTACYEWSQSVLEYFKGKYIRKTQNGNYECCLGIYKTVSSENEAQQRINDFVINRIIESALSNGDTPEDLRKISKGNYLASSFGNIYNFYGKIMIGAVDRCGYKEVILNKNKERVHRVIAETFIGNPNNYPCVNHIDGNKLNNNVSNLEWCNHSQNVLHAYKTGLEKIQISKRRKFSEQEVIEMRKRYTEGTDIRTLSIHYKADRKTIASIVKFITYKEITNDPSI